jgi:hypothetical protein
MQFIERYDFPFTKISIVMKAEDTFLETSIIYSYRINMPLKRPIGETWHE